MTFSEKFCATRAIPPEKYEEVVLRLSLRPMARLLRPVFSVLAPDYFAADRALVKSVGRITRLREFEAEAVDFAHDPVNRGFLRRTLQLRASTRRLRDVVRATLHDKT